MRIAFLIGLALLFLDQAIKYCTQFFLPLQTESLYQYPYGGIGVFPNFLGIEFSLNHATNRGAAWGLFASHSLLLFFLRIGLIAFLIFSFKRLAFAHSLEIPLALIIAGAIGNVIDVAVYGHVIDMFHFVLWGYDYPVFNLADSAICLGIVSYLILSKSSSKTHDSPSSP